MLAILGLLVLFVVPALVVGWVNGAPTSFLFFDQETAEAANVGLSPYFMSVAMLIGVVFGAFYEALRLKPDDPALQTLKQAVKGAYLYRALLASPILFGGVYAVAATNPDSVVAIVFSFQNGFFCETILRQRVDALKQRNATP